MRISLWITMMSFVAVMGWGFDPSQQDDSMAVVRLFERPGQPALKLDTENPVPVKGETVSLIGGAEVFKMRKNPSLEVALQSGYPKSQLKVRNLGWSADTVYRQQRPMFFYTAEGDQREGSVPDGRARVEPGLMILFFGKMESLDGEDRLDEFENAYEKLLLELKKLTGRMVLVAPVPFSKSGPAGELADERNAVLAKYSDVIARLAKRHQLGFFDAGEYDDELYDRGGVLLADEGIAELSGRLALYLGCEVGENPALDSLIREKDLLWEQYHRPTNWAFLYGDRQHVPSSRDHRDANRRWFEEELESIPPLLESTEAMIWQAAKGGRDEK